MSVGAGHVLSDIVARRAAVTAAAIFWPALFAFAALYPGYSHCTRAISGLGAFGAPHALAWNLVGFVVPGLLLAASGGRMALAIDGRRTTAFWLLVASGLGFAGAGVFPAEMRNGMPLMQSPWTAAHVLMISASGFPWLVAAVVLVRLVSRNARWRRSTGVVLILALLAVVSFSFNVFADAIPILTDANGLAQRMAFAGYFAWFGLAESLFVPWAGRAQV
jgi:hypothetical membrane protein